MKAWHLGVITLHCFIAHASKKTAAFYLYINGGGNHQVHTTKAGANVNFLVFIYNSIAQVQTDAPESGYQTSPMEWLTMLDVFVTTKAGRTTDALAILIEG